MDISSRKNKETKKSPEIIAGVGNWEMLQAAAKANADAVYFGIVGLNMRNFAKNFELSELKKVVDFCHKNKMRAYLTLNTIVYEQELQKVEKIITDAKKSKIDAIIVFDFAAIELCKKHKVKFHISTQMSISNSVSAKFFEKLGAERIVLARECSFKDLQEIKKKTKTEIELFIHGAMCFSVSGRCYLSLFLHDKSANRGECTQPCRRILILEGFKKENEKPVEIYENTIMSSKDLCTITFFDKLLDAGFKYFKIEGRTKTPEYIYTVTKTYKTAIELWKNKKLSENAKTKLINELKTVFNRGFTDGFYFDIPNYKDVCTEQQNKKTDTKIFLGDVDEVFKKLNVFGILHLQHKVSVSDLIQIEGKNTFIRTKVLSLHKNKKSVNSANKGDIGIKIKELPKVKDKVFLIKSK